MKIKNIYHINIFLFIVSLILISSCRNKFNVDLSEIEKCNTKIHRYDADLFSEPLNDERLTELQEKYPLFLGNQALNAEQKEQLNNYINDSYLQELYEESQKKFPNLSKEEVQLSNAFEHIRYYFSSFQYPHVFTYISGSQEKAYYQDHTLILSIDRYLGVNHEFYDKAGIPKYMQNSMNPQFICRDAIEAIAKSYITEPTPDENILAQMIYHGKLLYFIKSMIPEIPENILFAQTEDHLNWLQEKRKDLWRYYIENQLLYKSDYETYKKFITETPFTSVLGDDSAPMTGRWLGFNIVESYMESNKISLEKMLQIRGDQEFLNHSKYKP